jgi:phosphate transport system substrate-binding protein
LISGIFIWKKPHPFRESGKFHAIVTLSYYAAGKINLYEGFLQCSIQRDPKVFCMMYPLIFKSKFPGLMIHRFIWVMILFGIAGADVAFSSEYVVLSGEGATFPQPLYEKWISEYQAKNNVKISYHAVGSGKGIKALIDQTVDFGATDAFLIEEELASAPMEILHLPTCLGAVAVIYNLPGAYSLRLTPEILSLMLSGGIKRWTDERIGAGNDGAVLPDLEITVVHRSDSSGTTYILSDYLSKVDPAWRYAVGSGTLIRWPVGIGVEKNQGVARTVAKIPGSIGYVEFTYAKKHALAMALMRNKSGNYILPDIDAASKAAVISMPADTRVMITNTDDPLGYPISAFTWLIFYREQAYGARHPERARALVDFLWWIIHDGQRYNASINYAPLPEPVVRHAENIIRSITFDKKPVMPHSFR